MIWMILCFVGVAGLFVVTVFFADEDWSVWVELPCALLAIITMLIGIATEDKKPRVVHTKTPPQIDTVITIRSRIPDTTYIYTFSKEEQK